jgi:hypothetical protein
MKTSRSKFLEAALQVRVLWRRSDFRYGSGAIPDYP